MTTLLRRDAHELLRTSLHEAGHAVVAHMLGVGSGRVTVTPSGGAPGSCKQRTPFWALERLPDQQQQRVDNYLVVACAGWGAERVIYGDVDDEGSSDDMQIFRETLMDSPIAFVQWRNRKRADLFLQSFQELRCEAAAAFLEPHKGLLYAVARLLLRKGTVEAAEIHALLDRMLVEGW